MGLVYTLIYSIGFVLLTPVFLYRMWKRGKYLENFGQRFGVYSEQAQTALANKNRQRCWIQAVSVGEVNVAVNFINVLTQRMPQLQVVLTTTTSTGYAIANERLPKEVQVLYFPQDFPWSVRRAYDLIQPDFIVLMESEIWPNHIWTAARRNIPVIIVNGRMSIRSARSYCRFHWLFRRVLSEIALFCVQTKDDEKHFCAAGAPSDRVVVVGNMKYDVSMPYAAAQSVDPTWLLKQIGITLNRPVIVAGSTHPGEEEILFKIFVELKNKFRDLFLVLVPRHVERTEEVLESAKRWPIKVILRTDINSSLLPTARPYDCLLVDTTGELRWLYKIATVIFVGKSLVGRGGQNIVEAAASDHPVVFGPNMQNFKAIVEQFVEAKACVQVQDRDELNSALTSLLRDQQRREQIVAAARKVIKSNLGATARIVDMIDQLLRRKIHQ